MKSRAGAWALSTRGVAILWFASAVAAAYGCTAADAGAPSPGRVAFSSLLADSSAVQLTGSDVRLLNPVSGLLIGSEIVVLDANAATALAFDVHSGALRGKLGGPGDDLGSFRHPTAIAAVDAATYAIYDNGRRVLSFRDSGNSVLREIRVPEGSYTGIISANPSHSATLSGAVFYVQGSARTNALHEIGASGKLMASYAPLESNGRSTWKQSFSAVFAAQDGDDTYYGSQVSNRLQVYNKRTGDLRKITVAKGWYQPPEWPSDGLLSRGVSRETAAEQIRHFQHQHTLMSGVFTLPRHHLLVRFQSFDPDGRRLFYYATSGPDGATSTVTYPTRAQVVYTSADTVYWVDGGGSTEPRFGWGVLRFP